MKKRLIDCKFDGNINDYRQVNAFLRQNLYAAKYHPDFISDYEAYRIEEQERLFKDD